MHAHTVALPVHLDIITRYSLQQETIADITVARKHTTDVFCENIQKWAADPPLPYSQQSAVLLIQLVSFGHEAENLDINVINWWAEVHRILTL